MFDRSWKAVPLLAIVPLAFVLAASAEEMTSGQLDKELVGKSIVWWQQDGWQLGSLVLLPGGIAEISIDTPDQARDTGRWAIRGDRICTEWRALRQSTEKCYTVERADDGRFLTSGGNVFQILEAGV